MIYINIFFAIIQIIVITSHIRKKNMGLLYQAAALFILYWVSYYFRNSIHLTLNLTIWSLIILTLTGHTLLGQNLNLYKTSKAFDRVLHLFGTLTFAFVGLYVLNSLTRPYNIPKIYNAVFAAAIGVSAGVLLELLEYALDFYSHSFNQKGLEDTNTDMIFNLFGAILSGTFGYLIR